MWLCYIIAQISYRLRQQVFDWKRFQYFGIMSKEVRRLYE